MKPDAKYPVALLLVVSAGLLAVMVPGGQVETRSFAQLSPLTLVAFNTFLTTLGVCSCVVAYWALRGRRVAFVQAAVCGGLYLLVYALDLAGVFPVSADAMPPVLAALEWAGSLVALALFFLALRNARTARRETPGRPSGRSGWFVFAVALVCLGAAGVIVFATRAAMR